MESRALDMTTSQPWLINFGKLGVVPPDHRTKIGSVPRSNCARATNTDHIRSTGESYDGISSGKEALNVSDRLCNLSVEVPQPSAVLGQTIALVQPGEP